MGAKEKEEHLMYIFVQIYSLTCFYNLFLCWNVSLAYEIDIIK